MGSDISGEAEDIELARKAIADNKASYIWYIAAHRDPEGPFLAFLKAEYELMVYEPFRGADVWLFKKK